jgi:hypothetical protein
VIDVTHYLKRDWVLGEYECWALVVEVYQRELNVSLPRANLGTTEPKSVRREFANHHANNLFEQIPEPKHLSVVAMGKRWLSHVGVYLDTNDGPRILHNRRVCGVLCQHPNDVKRDITILGYYQIKKSCL